MKILYHIFAVILLASVVSCNNSSPMPSTTAYEVSCTLSRGLKLDSATLYLVEENYNSLIDQGMCKRNKQGEFSWKGCINEPMAAFIKFEGDSTPVYFVLDPGVTNITINKHSKKIVGGKTNNEYMAFIAHRKGILDHKDKLNEQYIKHIGDSTLTVDIEKDFHLQDSLLTDSLQRYTTWRINAGGPVSVIVKERFFKTLTSEYQKKLN